MALRANRPNPGAGAPAAPAQNPVGAPAAPAQNPVGAGAPANTNLPATASTNTAVAPAVNPGAVQDLNAGVLDNIENLGATGNFITMDGSEFYLKASEERFTTLDVQVCYGKRYYQWVEEEGESKTFHNSDTKLDDRYKLRFEIHWKEEDEEGTEVEYQFHMPTASAMRFIDYVKELAKAGLGIGNVVTRMSISRQVQKGTTNRYSRAEFTMVGTANPDGSWTEVPNGITTVGKQ